MEKVDVIINVYGKPWQTLCSLKSLMKESGQHIDKIYFIEETNQPYNENVEWLITKFDNMVYYKPNKYVFTPGTYSFGDLNIPENRYNFRYQYGIEKSDKKHVFIMHNDILFTGDIIGDMLSEINDCAGIGLIGQCWNCSCKYSGVCDGDKFNDFKPMYGDVMNYVSKYPPARGQQFINMIDKNNLMPLPECRLNEFACLVNRKICAEESYPNGNTPLFGSHDGIDTASAWFKGLFLKGYKFKNYDINKTCVHGYYTSVIGKYNTTGYVVQRDFELYRESENGAKNYFENNLI